MLLEDARVHMGTGGAAVRVVDPDTNEVRPSTLADIANDIAPARAVIFNVDFIY